VPGQSPLEHLEGPVLFSACLLDIPCRYDGSAKALERIIVPEAVIRVPVCPEQLGGLPTPRPPAQFAGGDGRAVLAGRARLVDARGRDVTALFIEGARHTLSIARITGACAAVLKENSPSCATRRVWIEGSKVPGIGVTTALLLDNGITVMDQEGLL
jgi:uncharacterized protein YbbK (DUF523 family)